MEDSVCNGVINEGLEKEDGTQTASTSIKETEEVTKPHVCFNGDNTTFSGNTNVEKQLEDAQEEGLKRTSASPAPLNSDPKTPKEVAPLYVKHLSIPLQDKEIIKDPLQAAESKNFSDSNGNISSVNKSRFPEKVDENSVELSEELNEVSKGGNNNIAETKSDVQDVDYSNSLDVLGDKKLLDMDKMLVIVGEFGIFQKIVNAMYCIMAIPAVFNLVLMEFVAYNPPWKCISGSSMCVWNGTFESTNKLRCNVPRNEWMYTVPKESSIVTYFDINCSNEWLISLSSSILFAGWIIGSFILGWLTDKYGRKIVIFGSLVIILTVGLGSTFSPNIYIFIACRFIVGIFTAGSYPNMIVSITEIVGIRRRPLASLMICLFLSIGLSTLGIKAYLIRQWKYLNIACTAPYLLLLLFHRFIPESIRYLILKGRTDEAMAILHNIAIWNKKEIPADVAIAPTSVIKSKRSAGPFDLIRSKSLFVQNIVLAFSWFTLGASDIGLFLASDDFGGNMYRDYILLTLAEIPFGVLAMYVLERFGRKKTVTVSMLVSSLNFIFLCLVPKTGRIKIARIIIALFIKVFIVLALNSMYTWTVEIYPTKLRGMAMGMAQVLNGIGSGSAPWFVHELKNIRAFVPYVTLGMITFLSCCFLCLLPESKGVPLSEAKKKNKVEDDSPDDLPIDA